MARLIYSPDIPDSEFEKERIKVSVSNKHMGTLPDKPHYLHTVAQAFGNQCNVEQYTSDDTVYLVGSMDKDFPYHLLEEAVYYKSSFVLDKPADRRKNPRQQELADYLFKSDYVETALRNYSLFDPRIPASPTRIIERMKKNEKPKK